MQLVFLMLGYLSCIFDYDPFLLFYPLIGFGGGPKIQGPLVKGEEAKLYLLIPLLYPCLALIPYILLCSINLVNLILI